MNKFMLFAKLERPELREKCPDMNTRDINVLLGKKMHQLSLGQRKEYEHKADDLKREHKTEYPGDKLCPK